MSDLQNQVPRISDSSRWFHPHISGKEAENLLKTKGYVGSFLVRDSLSEPGNYTLSVRRETDVIHVHIQNNGDYYDISTGSEFASLIELVSYYTEQGNPLKEVNGNLVEAKYPLYNNEPPTSDPWFHGALDSMLAEKLLKQQGIVNSFLVRERKAVPGEFVLCVLTGPDVVKNIIMLFKGGDYFIKAACVINRFKSLSSLIEYYKTKPIAEGSGNMILLGKPLCVGVTSSSTGTRSKPHSNETAAPPAVREVDKSLEEFEHLQKQECLNKSPRTEGQKPENKEKNRYKNILPFDKTRVILNDGNPSSYINANYIKLPGYQQSYIATQGCLAGTVSDFWRMIWQEGSQIIAMITRLVEQGKNKCTRYWPESANKPVVIDSSSGRMTVSLIQSRKSSTEAYEIREFVIIREIERDDQPGEFQETGRRSVYHYNFTAWPDKMVPESPKCLIEMLIEVNRHQEHLQNSAPIVVHCSAGIGRTGTFIALGFILEDLLNRGLQHEIKVKDIVATIREQRSGMVQTENQYKFIYDTVKYCIDNDVLGGSVQDEYANFESAKKLEP